MSSSFIEFYFLDKNLRTFCTCGGSFISGYAVGVAYTLSAFVYSLHTPLEPHALTKKP